jgi:hypothetical protein
MTNVSLSRRFALVVGGLAIAGMGLTVGCSAKQSPAPTEQTDNQVDSKRAKDDSGADSGSKNSYAPKVKAPAAPNAKPGNTPGDN